MSARGRSEPWMALVAVAALGLAATWRWHGVVFRAPSLEEPDDRSDHVKEAYPLPTARADSPALDSERLDGMVAANAFSPKRRTVPPRGAGGSGASDDGTVVVPKPVFVYKGRINLGKRQRAILEEAASRKTHFLEVGQAVTGFKVLDISEQQVILFDVETNEEVVVSISQE